MYDDAQVCDPTPPGPTRPSESTRHAAARGLAPRPTHTPPSTPNRAFCPPCSAAREPPCAPPARYGAQTRPARASPRPSVSTRPPGVPLAPSAPTPDPPSTPNAATSRGIPCDYTYYVLHGVSAET